MSSQHSEFAASLNKKKICSEISHFTSDLNHECAKTLICRCMNKKTADLWVLDLDVVLHIDLKGILMIDLIHKRYHVIFCHAGLFDPDWKI